MWRDLLDARWIDLYLTSLEALFESRTYPLYAQLTDLLQSAGVTQYDANTIIAVVNALLSETHYLEETYLVERPAYEACVLHPSAVHHYTNDILRADLESVLVLIALLGRYASAPHFGGRLFLRGWDSNGLLTVSATIIRLTHARDELDALRLPLELTEEVDVAGTLRDIILASDEIELLENATSAEDVEDVIRIAVFRHRCTAGGDPHSPLPRGFSVGERFLETARRCCAHNRRTLLKKVLRAIVKTVEAQDLRAVHALRTGAGPNDPQQMRGTDKAWRRDVDDELHLHYWESPRSVEFASVVPHNDMSIPA